MNYPLLKRAIPLALSLSLTFGAAVPALASLAKAADLAWSFAKCAHHRARDRHGESGRHVQGRGVPLHRRRRRHRRRTAGNEGG